MKKAILTAVFILINSICVNAGTSDDILAKYSVKSKTEDAEVLKAKLKDSFENYGKLADTYYKSTYLNNAEELAVARREKQLNEIDTEKCMTELERLRDCLDAMVNVDASFEEIEDIENQYREKQKELNELIMLKSICTSKIPHYSTNTGEVSYEQITEALADINELRSEIGKSAVKEDIGEINGLKSPTKGVFDVTSTFGNRTNPITQSGIEKHSGLDLAAPKDTPVLSLFKGTVISADYSNSLGNYVIVAHSSELQTLYAHMNSLNVKKGDIVNQYDTIGFVGTTGSSTGYHLHLGVYINGIKSDPQILFER